jgi:hypothetical protein
MAAKNAMLKYLSKGKTLTTKQARTLFKVTNVAARIHDLRNDGHAIMTHMKTAQTGRTAVYQLVGA